MSCFSCCEEDEFPKSAESGGENVVKNSAGNDGNYHASETAKQGAQTVKIQPIEVPDIPVDELKDITDSFGESSLIGEGSYERVYHGVLKSGQAAAIKKLDASKQPDEEFLAQLYVMKDGPSVYDTMPIGPVGVKDHACLDENMMAQHDQYMRIDALKVSWMGRNQRYCSQIYTFVNMDAETQSRIRQTLIGVSSNLQLQYKMILGFIYQHNEILRPDKQHGEKRNFRLHDTYKL